MNNPKYLVTFEGLTSGTYAGRDDGYPETKIRVVDSLAEAGGYADAKDAKLYALTPANFADALKALKRKEADEKKAELKKKVDQEIEQLKKLQDKYPNLAKK